MSLADHTELAVLLALGADGTRKPDYGGFPWVGGHGGLVPAIYSDLDRREETVVQSVESACRDNRRVEFGRSWGRKAADPRLLVAKIPVLAIHQKNLVQREKEVVRRDETVEAACRNYQRFEFGCSCRGKAADSRPLVRQVQVGFLQTHGALETGR